MRRSIRELVQLIARHLKPQPPIFELGSFQVQPPSLSDLRPLFPGLEYMGCDMRKGPGVDLVCDFQELHQTLPPECAGTVLCLDTLEHVEHPRQALSQMHRMLQPGGLLLLATVMDFPIHEHPHDFWRFTPYGLASLLAPFESALVDWAGPERHPHTVLGLAWKGAVPTAQVQAMQPDLSAWKRHWQASPD